MATTLPLPDSPNDRPNDRIVTLDIVRGVAVMGILALNIVGFAMPEAAYINPRAYGTESAADLAAWAFNFVFLDGRFRGLFSVLFGASMLLVIDRAMVSGQSPARVHYARMAWLLVFGLLHFYLIWFGDILALYALVGLVAFLFRHQRPRALLWWAAGLLIVQMLMFAAGAASFFVVQAAASAPDASAEAVRAWGEMQRGLAPYEPQRLREALDLHLGSFINLARHQLTEQTFDPFASVLFFGLETLGLFLLGMAGYRSGFLTGAWPDAVYRRCALWGFVVGIPLYALLAWWILASDFDVPTLFAGFALTVPIRVVMIAAVAALIILLTRRGGAIVERIAAAGRAAFTNYLGTSILMTFVFNGWGLGLYGSLSRAQLWIPVLLTWAIILAWSKPWLDRFAYGPFEWLWRSLARGEVASMRKRPIEPAGVLPELAAPPEAGPAGLDRIGARVEQRDGAGVERP